MVPFLEKLDGAMDKCWHSLVLYPIQCRRGSFARITKIDSKENFDTS